ncbi:hypothetical protein H5410_005510 [Solanum commersonii]|uniref:Uncharacterized protein n=1 Tax=Solanum commersonii TaxID=4109 RepID=A0A9J6A7R9_SOLCO|nr:hypothetical protein H5410_005510 [Solanum commersonii]
MERYHDLVPVYRYRFIPVHSDSGPVPVRSRTELSLHPGSSDQVHLGTDQQPGQIRPVSIRYWFVPVRWSHFGPNMESHLMVRNQRKIACPNTDFISRFHIAIWYCMYYTHKNKGRKYRSIVQVRNYIFQGFDKLKMEVDEQTNEVREGVCNKETKSNNFEKREVKKFLGEARNNLMNRDFKHKNRVQHIVGGLVGNDDRASNGTNGGRNEGGRGSGDYNLVLLVENICALTV